MGKHTLLHCKIKTGRCRELLTEICFDGTCRYLIFILPLLFSQRLEDSPQHPLWVRPSLDIQSLLLWFQLCLFLRGVEKDSVYGLFHLSATYLLMSFWQINKGLKWLKSSFFKLWWMLNFYVYFLNSKVGGMRNNVKSNSLPYIQGSDLIPTLLRHVLLLCFKC